MEPHYELALLTSDIYGGEDTNFVIGLAIPTFGTVVSIARLSKLEISLQLECIKTVIFHEMGHVFGLPNSNRKNINESLGAHCTNVCVMRQGLSVPFDWIKMTQDRIRMRAPYCKECLSDLRFFFR